MKKKNMKRFAILLIALLAMSMLASCGDKKPGKEDSAPTLDDVKSSAVEVIQSTDLSNLSKDEKASVEKLITDYEAKINEAKDADAIATLLDEYDKDLKKLAGDKATVDEETTKKAMAAAEKKEPGQGENDKTDGSDGSANPSKASGSGSPGGSNPSSGNSGSGGASGNPPAGDGSPGGSTATHTHSWTAVTHTESQRVLVQAAYDEEIPIYGQICNGCGFFTTDGDEMAYHMITFGHSCSNETRYEIVHHDAVYENKTVTVTETVCSSCGAKK